MKLKDVVEAIVEQNDISDAELENAALYLVFAVQKPCVLRRITKKLNEIIEYEDAPL